MTQYIKPESTLTIDVKQKLASFTRVYKNNSKNEFHSFVNGRLLKDWTFIENKDGKIYRVNIYQGLKETSETYLLLEKHGLLSEKTKLFTLLTLIIHDDSEIDRIDSALRRIKSYANIEERKKQEQYSRNYNDGYNQQSEEIDTTEDPIEESTITERPGLMTKISNLFKSSEY